MVSVTVPKLTLTFSVELELAYNSFDGKTVEEITEAIQDDLHDLIFELDQVTGVYSNCTSTNLDD